MTEATKRPWYATGIHVQSAAINEDNYVCTAEGNSPEQAIANADLIVKAVNAHDALVAACEAMRDSGMFDWEGAIAYEEEAALVMAALEAAK
jgi:uncharacterized protein involved in tolerance to divalent cations